MSVINQVLSQLEQRGAHAAPEQTMVRAVPYSKRKSAIPLLALGLVLTAGIAVWQWIQMRKPALSLVEGPQVVAASGVQLQPVVAIPAPVPAVPAAAIAADTASAVIAGEAPLAEMLQPASRLSFELSSIPLPSTLRPFDKVRDGPLLQAQDRLRSEQVTSTRPLALSKDEERTENPAPQARPARQQPIQAALQNERAAVQASGGVSPMKRVSSAQRAEAEFRKAAALMQQGHITDAIAGYEAVLRLDAGHDAARQALVALLLENKRGADAERVLRDGLKNEPEHTGFAMMLARLQVEHGTVEQAMATLEKSLPYADSQADYQAFFAALLQRQNRHKEAITHYQIALQLAPDNGVWLMGYGISLQAAQRTDDARDAFRRALESRTLTPELQAFVQQKLKGL